MKNLKIFIYLNILILLFTSCATVKKGFQNPKKNNSDEFLVEKKSPLVMPPNYDDLPIPKSNQSDDQTKNNTNQIQDLITNNENKNTDNANDNTQGQTFEKLILEKIND